MGVPVPLGHGMYDEKCACVKVYRQQCKVLRETWPGVCKEESMIQVVRCVGRKEERGEEIAYKIKKMEAIHKLRS